MFTWLFIFTELSLMSRIERCKSVISFSSTDAISSSDLCRFCDAFVSQSPLMKNPPPMNSPLPATLCLLPTCKWRTSISLRFCCFHPFTIYILISSIQASSVLTMGTPTGQFTSESAKSQRPFPAVAVFIHRSIHLYIYSPVHKVT